jgi:hypothetical protein
VTDHFGKPDPALGVDDSGFRHLLSTGHIGRVWVKRSRAYRNGDGAVGDRIAKAAIPLLRDNFGVDHVAWGSDWPHTQFESVAKYPILRARLDAWLPGPGKRRTVRFSHRSVFSSLRFSSALRPQLPCSDVRNYLTHVTNTLLLVGTDRNPGFDAVDGSTTGT